ncbi:MAG TPA: hypothetical protein VEK57_06455 [Thermoanaerobaculia bacterium]|nr:hypothetical protein [Thermoanaerobaculia bacterium]
MSTVQFRSATLKFNSAKGGEQTQSTSVLFGSKVLEADAAIKSFKIGYTGEDHELKYEKIKIDSVTKEGTQVGVQVTFALRDSSGTFDDAYEGYVEVMVSAVLDEAA